MPASARASPHGNRSPDARDAAPAIVNEEPRSSRAHETADTALSPEREERAPPPPAHFEDERWAALYADLQRMKQSMKQRDDLISRTLDLQRRQVAQLESARERIAALRSDNHALAAQLAGAGTVAVAATPKAGDATKPQFKSHRDDAGVQEAERAAAEARARALAEQARATAERDLRMKAEAALAEVSARADSELAAMRADLLAARDALAQVHALLMDGSATAGSARELSLAVASPTSLEARAGLSLASGSAPISVARLIAAARDARSRAQDARQQALEASAELDATQVRVRLLQAEVQAREEAGTRLQQRVQLLQRELQEREAQVARAEQRVDKAQSEQQVRCLRRCAGLTQSCADRVCRHSPSSRPAPAVRHSGAACGACAGAGGAADAHRRV